MRNWFLVMCCVFASQTVRAIDNHSAAPPDIIWEETSLAALNAALEGDTLSGPRHERLTAALLAATLGPFGAHRLYFGTVAKVPIIYGITFGGFGVLVILDLAHILFTKDLAPYRRNNKVFMWARPRERTTPP